MTLFDTPLANREHPNGLGGIQRIYRFPNGYGASVVRFSMPFGRGYGSYTSNESEWELAILRFTSENGPDGFELDYETGITDDVMGHLTESQVEKVLKKIAKLKP